MVWECGCPYIRGVFVRLKRIIIHYTYCVQLVLKYKGAVGYDVRVDQERYPQQNLIESRSPTVEALKDCSFDIV